MKLEKKKCLMIFVEDSDMYQGERLYEVIVRQIHKHGLAGATAVTGIAGFGTHGRIHHKGLFGVSDEKPIVILAIDSEVKVKEALQAVASLVREGLICMFDTEVLLPDHSSV
jgi:PII-like signaling protein